MDADAADDPPVARVGHREARERVGAAGEERACVGFGIRLRDLVDPAGDLGLVQTFHEHVDVARRPRPERHHAVRKRRTGGNRGTAAHGD